MSIIKLLYILILSLVLNGAVYASTWNYMKNEDAMGDGVQEIAMTGSISEDDGIIMVRCSGGTELELVFSVGDFVGKESLLPIRLRVDKREVLSSEGYPSTKGDGVFLSAYDAVRLSRELFMGSEVLLEITDYNGTPVRSTFSLEGSEKVGKILNACNVEQEGKLEAIPSSVKSMVEAWGPKTTACGKKKLTALGYSFTELSSQKTPELFLAFNAYLDEKNRTCDRAAGDIGCGSDFMMLSELYSDAVDADPKIRDECGHFRQPD